MPKSYAELAKDVWLTKCREFVREQCQGDWPDETIEDDAQKLFVMISTNYHDLGDKGLC